MIFSPPSPRNKKFAWATVLYLALFYGTLGSTPPFFRWFLREAGRPVYSWSILLFLVGCGIGVLMLVRGRIFSLQPKRFVWLVAVLAGYGLILYLVRIPAKQLHTMQYGLLTWMVCESLRGRLTGGRFIALSMLLVMVVAAGDELIQWALPNRNGIVKDVMLDWFSAALAQITIYILSDSKGALEPGKSET